MSKQDVLKAFKSLHRVAQTTFQGDNRAIEEARKRINLEFRKKSEQELEEKLKVCREVEMILKHQVVQAVKSDDRDVYGV